MRGTALREVGFTCDIITSEPATSIALHFLKKEGEMNYEVFAFIFYFGLFIHTAAYIVACRHTG